MLGLGTIFYVALLLVNSIAILNEERFLSRSTSDLLIFSRMVYKSPFSQQLGCRKWRFRRQTALNSSYKCCSSITTQYVLLLPTVLTFSVPLIIINVLVIIYELILG